MRLKTSAALCTAALLAGVPAFAGQVPPGLGQHPESAATATLASAQLTVPVSSVLSKSSLGKSATARISIRSNTSAVARPVQPSWFSSSTIYEVNVRQYTAAGTFKAFTSQLPRLKTLGVKVLWLMPVYPIGQQNRLGSLGSYYSVRDYRAVNPEFGTSAQFKTLVDKAHAAGFKVILDWVANHTAWDNPWITAHPDWYLQGRDGQIVSPPGTGWSDVAQLDYTNAAMRSAMIDALAMWVRTYGIDGFRADVASMGPADFWNQAAEKLQAIKPLLMLAEAETRPALMQRAFLLDYNWNLYHKLNQVGAGWVDTSGVQDIVNAQVDEYGTTAMPMNFITNHDENSWNGSEYERLGAGVAPLTVFYFTMPGVPLIYTGQEMGLTRRLKFFDRDPITWQTVPINALLTRLVGLKAKNRALWNVPGQAPVVWLPTNNDQVFAYSRKVAGDSVVILVNASADTQNVRASLGAVAGQSYISLATGKSITLGATRKTVLKPYSYEVFTTFTWR